MSCNLLLELNIFILIASATNNQNVGNGGSTNLSSQEELYNSKGESNNKQSRESNATGKKKNSDQNVNNTSQLSDINEPSILESMETEIQSPAKKVSHEKEKPGAQKQQTSIGRMDPPKGTGTKKGSGNPAKPASNNIVPVPQTSSTVGGPSLTNKSSVGSTNQDFSSFRTYR